MGKFKQQDAAADSLRPTAIWRTGRLLVAGIIVALLTAGTAMAANAPPLMVTPGQFNVSSTGAATYSVPIQVPPGTAGVVPALSLNYSSQNGDGFVGLGWALNGIPAVTRCPRTLAQDGVHGSVNYDSNDQFCLDGQRLISTGTTSTLCASGTGTVYSTEIQSFSRVISCGSSGSGPAYFKAWTKAGQIMEFGNTSDSQALVIAVVGGTPPSGTVRKWAVNKISDVMQNYMTVTYSCAPTGGSCVSGETYPTQIDYTGNSSASVSPYNSVRFSYTTRVDSAPMYQAGGVVQQTVVLTDIKTYQGSNLVWDYQLGYRAGTSTLHSHLTSLTQCDNASHCLPATNFGWQGITSINISTPSATPPQGVLAPADFNGDGLTDVSLVGNCSASSYPIYLGQPSFGFSLSGLTVAMPSGISSWPMCFAPFVAGTLLAPDGTSDILISVLSFKTSGPPPLSQFYTALFTSAGSVNLANFTSTTIATAQVYAGDYNGDGIIDFSVIGSPTSYGYLGNGSGGFTQDSGVGGLNGAIFPADFDGDGCTDLLSLGTTSNLLVYAYNCHPAAATATPPSWTGFNVIAADFNGDGKTDLLYTSTSAAGTLYFSTGTGFTASSASIPSGWTIIATGDWNGDGKADLVVQVSGSSDYALYLSTGNGFTPALDSMGNPVVFPNAATNGYTVVVADWDNNGNSDILLQDSSLNGTFQLISYTPELMTSVSNGVGATTTITYNPINQGSPFYTKGSNTYPTQDMIGPQYVVSEVDSSNGLGTCNPASSYTYCYRTTYTYAGAVKDLKGRGFLGFAQIAADDLQTNIVRTTVYCTLFPLTGLVSTDTRVHSGTTLSSITNTYNSAANCGATATTGVNVVQLTQTVAVANDLNGAAFPTTTTNYTYDSYSNALTVDISVSDGSSKNTTNTYNNDTTNWFLGRLLTTSVNSIVGSSNMTRQSSFAYSSTNGLLTQESIEPGVSTCNGGSAPCELDTSYTYDVFGHRITTTVSGSGITTRTSYAFYDSYGQFMTSAANALGQYEFWAYDARFGGPASHTGPNFLTTTWSYDSFGRVTQEVRPDGTQTNQSYAYCSGSCPTYGQFYARSEIDGPGGSPQVGPVAYAYYDMLSRGIANDNQGFDGSNIRVATVYDSNGRVQETSRPYFTATASPAWTQYSYDALGRVLTATFPDSSVTTYVFNGLTTTVTNNLSQTTTTVKNAQDLNYLVTDATSHTTTYIYDAYGDLLTVTDPNGNAITNTFDIRGNKVASQNPDMGSWTYAYDVLAELTSQTDAKSQSTTLTYDVLGRALTRTENSLYGAWTYGTTASNHNVGQVVEAKACPTSACASIVSDKTYQFDGVGRESQYTLQTPTDYFGYTTSYNSSNGQIANITYPSGYLVSRNYNTTGFLTQLTDSSGIPIWTISARDAELHITSQTAGNNVTTTQSFNLNTGLIQNQRAGASAAVASFDYSFDTIGNLTSRSDNSQPYTERFCYDSLNRLTNYNIGAACTGGSSVAYDTLGNITSKSDAGSYSYGGGRPHAVSSITGTVDGLTNPQYSYDGNGNLTCVSSGGGCSGTIGRTVNLTSFNMALSIDQGSNSLSMTYDDQHQRLQQTNTVSSTTTTKTVYLNDAANGAMSQRVTVSGTTPTDWNSFNWGSAPWGGTTANALPTWTDYITIDGQIVAQRNVQYRLASAWGLQNWNSFNWGAPAGSLWGSSAATNPPRFKWGTDPWSGNAVTWGFFNLDHLGSVAVITDQGGNVVQRLSYDAWGKQRNANGSAAACGTITSSTTKGFTNQEEMPTQCLVNLNARLYDPSIGKFMAADTVVPDPYNGQSYNRYGYVTNNPLSFVDPTGHEGIESVEVSHLADPGFSIAPGAASLGAGTYGDQNLALPPSQMTTPVTPNSNFNQTNQTQVTFRPPNTCSRAGGRANDVCGGSYLYSITITFNSSGANANAAQVAGGGNGSPGTNWIQNAYCKENGCSGNPLAQDTNGGCEAGVECVVVTGNRTGGLQLTQEILPPIEIPELVPLEELPPGSANGPGAGKAFPRNLGRPTPGENTPDCLYCGKPTTKKPGPDQFNRDHIVPKSQGGDNTPDNMAPSCRTCNLQKGPRTPTQWYQDIQAWIDPYEKRLGQIVLQIRFG